MTFSSFDSVLTPTLEPHASTEQTQVFSFVVPPGYGQGKATFGGLVIGAMCRAMEQTLADPSRSLRSLTTDLMASPVAGVCRIRTRVLRRGSSVTTMASELEQDGSVLAHSTAMYAGDRAIAMTWTETLQEPQLPGERLHLPPGLAPEFTQHFLYDAVHGLPYSGGQAKTAGWVQPREPVHVFDSAWLAAMADAWWL